MDVPFGMWQRNYIATSAVSESGNNKRIKGKLKGMSPVQYRTHSLNA